MWLFCILDRMTMIASISQKRKSYSISTVTMAGRKSYSISTVIMAGRKTPPTNCYSLTTARITNTYAEWLKTMAHFTNKVLIG